VVIARAWQMADEEAPLEPLSKEAIPHARIRNDFCGHDVARWTGVAG
jgi:hypothetical protein